MKNLFALQRLKIVQFAIAMAIFIGIKNEFVLAYQHSNVLNLVPIEDATHVASTSGDWSDDGVWAGNPPTTAARVVIPQGVTVTVDLVNALEFKTIRVDGILNFATDRNTELRVDTLVTTMTGELVIGTATSPIQSDVTARIVFSDDGPIDTTWDPAIISRGALLMGATTMHGAAKTAFVSSEGASQGASQIALSEVPAGWRVNDTLCITGVEPNNPSSDELVSLESGVGSPLINLDSTLERSHLTPRSDLEIHVANLTRNIQFESENTSHRHRGHMMIMHGNNVDIRYVSFQGMGRTDKSIDLEDWRLISGSETSICPDDTIVESLNGFNVRGRYSVHFHRGGFGGQPNVVQGTVVRDDLGWAYVNHSSNVDFLDNVSHNVIGAAYNTEAGDELGSFVRNIAIRTVNPDGNPNPPDDEIVFEQSPDIRVLTQDFGWQGDGFWFHGSGVTVDDNVVSGASGHGFIYWTLGLVER
ncbi:MAG: G8 domain-containing protein, partial [Planctomycetota bacterium]